MLFRTPAYTEHAISGPGVFALAYAAQDTTVTRGELGARLDQAFALDGGQLTLRARAAWVHDSNADRQINALFQTLPGASFTVNGAAPAADCALVSAGAEVAMFSGWTLGAKFDGEFAQNSQIYAGSGVIRFSW